LLISKNFRWQDWEEFNRNYIAFRLSLYSYLKKSTVSIEKLFSGGKMNISTDLKIKIPSVINIDKMDYRYPNGESCNIKVGTSFLNEAGAPFDSFMYVETIHDKPLLLAFQMKLSNLDSKSPMILNDQVINKEYNKIKNSVESLLPETDFICIILGRCEGNFDETKIPTNCIVMSKKEQMTYYGESYYHRLYPMS
jgi:hypothetical protein